jgi:hypothetical protein
MVAPSLVMVTSLPRPMLWRILSCRGTWAGGRSGPGAGGAEIWDVAGQGQGHMGGQGLARHMVAALTSCPATPVCWATGRRGRDGADGGAVGGVGWGNPAACLNHAVCLVGV